MEEANPFVGPTLFGGETFWAFHQNETHFSPFCNVKFFKNFFFFSFEDLHDRKHVGPPLT